MPEEGFDFCQNYYRDIYDPYCDIIGVGYAFHQSLTEKGQFQLTQYIRSIEHI